MDKQLENSNLQTTSKGLGKKVITLSSFYFLVSLSLSSFITVVVYMHQKYKHKGYGETYLTANSVSSFVTYFICPFIIEKFKNKSKLLIFICSLGQFINMLIPTLTSLGDSHEDPAQITVPPPSTLRFVIEIAANIIGGGCSGVFWVVLGIFMTEYTSKLPENKRGKYFSLSNIIVNLRLIAGPLITMVGLGLGGETIYFTILSLIIICSFPLIKLIENINMSNYKNPLLKIGQNTKDLDNDQNKSNQITEENEKEVPRASLFSYILQFIGYYKNVAYVIPCSLMAGLLGGFVSSSLSHLLSKPAQHQNNDIKISIALIFFGLGNVTGGYLSGFMNDKFSLRKAGYFVFSLVILGSIIESYCLYYQRNLFGASLVGFLSGVSYSYLYGYVGLICAINYQGNSFSISTNKQIAFVSFVGYQWIVAFLNNTCNMKLNMTYESLILIPLSLGAAYCIKLQTEESRKKRNTSGVSEIEMSKKVETFQNASEQFKQSEIGK